MSKLDFFHRSSFLIAFKYGDRAIIMVDIRKAVQDRKVGESIYQIMQMIKLNHIQTEKYVHYMVKCGFGFFVVPQRETCLLTGKGSHFLQFVEIQRTQSIK